MFLVRHPDSGNWFVTPEAWTWEDTEGYLAFRTDGLDDALSIDADLPTGSLTDDVPLDAPRLRLRDSRDALVSLASILNDKEHLIERLDSRLKRIQKIIDGEKKE
jgi:hypothetical protein